MQLLARLALFFSLAQIGLAQEIHEVNLVPTGDPLFATNGQKDSSSGEFTGFVPFNGGWVFTVTDDPQYKTSEDDLWFTDGTAAGTWQVLDGASLGLIGIEYLVPFQGELLFVSHDQGNNVVLWKTDVTPGDLEKVRVLTPADAYDWGFGNLSVVGGLVYFKASTKAHGSEIWRSDGTTAGTFRLADTNPGYMTSNASAVAQVPGTSLGCFASNVSLTKRTLWITDGTVEGTQLLFDPEDWGSGGGVGETFVELNGLLYFTASNSLFGSGIYRTDGTAAGTRRVYTFPPGIAYFKLSRAVLFGGLLYIPADFGEGLRLCTFDGTTLTALEAPGLEPFNDLYQPTELGGRLYFAASNSLGLELWSSDGTATGTSLVVDIAPGSLDGIKQGMNFGSNYKTIVHSLFGAEKIWFTGHVDGATERLWVSDGTAAGTLDIHGGALPPFVGEAQHLTQVDASTVLFAAETVDGQHGLWTSDGSQAGPKLVKSWAQAGTESSNPMGLISLDGEQVLFAADDGVHGRELFSWTPDAGVQLIADIVPGPDSSKPRALRAVWCGGRLLAFFLALSPDEGYKFWVTDGTPAGTQQLSDTVAQSEGAFLGKRVHQWGDRVAFTLGGSEAGIWASDGTPAGTVKVVGKDGDWNMGVLLGTLDGDLVHARWKPVENGAYLNRLVRTDGTAQGTTLLWESDVPHQGSVFAEWTPFDDRWYFLHDHPAFGEELWVTDGTPGGTGLVVDASKGQTNSIIKELTRHDGALYYVLNKGELQKVPSPGAAPVQVSDFEEDGTFTGLGAFSIHDLTSTGTGLYFGISFNIEPLTQVWRTTSDGLDVERVNMGDGHLWGLMAGVGEGPIIVSVEGADGTQLRLLHDDMVQPLTGTPGESHGLQTSFAVDAYGVDTKTGTRIFFAYEHPELGVELASIPLPGAASFSLVGSASHISLSASPPRIGSSVKVHLEGLPPGASLGALVFGLVAEPSPTPLLSDGSAAWVQPHAAQWHVFTPSGTSFDVNLGVPSLRGLIGVELGLQGVAFPNGSWPALGSNGVRLLIGP